MCLTVLEQEALVLLVRNFELSPILAIILQVTLELTREIILGIKVVNIQNVLSGRRANVVWWIAGWQWVWHRRIVWTCGALFAGLQVIACLEHVAFHVIFWVIFDSVHGEEVTAVQVTAMLLATVAVCHVKVEHVNH